MYKYSSNQNDYTDVDPAVYYEKISNDPSSAFSDTRTDIKKEPRKPGLAVAILPNDKNKTLQIKVVVRNKDVTKVPPSLVSITKQDLEDSASSVPEIDWNNVTAKPANADGANGENNPANGEDKFDVLNLTLTDVGYCNTGSTDKADSGNTLEEQTNKVSYFTSIEEIQNANLYQLPLINPKEQELLADIKKFNLKAPTKINDTQIAILNKYFRFQVSEFETKIFTPQQWKTLIDSVDASETKILSEKQKDNTVERLQTFSLTLNLKSQYGLKVMPYISNTFSDIQSRQEELSVDCDFPQVSYDTSKDLATTWEAQEIALATVSGVLGVAMIIVIIRAILYWTRRRQQNR